MYGRFFLIGCFLMITCIYSEAQVVSPSYRFDEKNQEIGKNELIKIYGKFLKGVNLTNAAHDYLMLKRIRDVKRSDIKKLETEIDQLDSAFVRIDEPSKEELRSYTENRLANSAKLDRWIKQEAKQDSFYQYRRVQNKKLNMFNFTKKRTKAMLNILYKNDNGDFSALKRAGLAFGDQTGTVFAELMSSDIGWFRTSLGTMVTSADSVRNFKNVDALRRLSTTGGNLVLNTECPLVISHSLDNQYVGIIRMNVKISGDLEEFGTTTNDFAGSVSTSFDLYGHMATDDGKLKAFALLNLGGYLGSDAYIDNLGLSRDKFVFGDLLLGLQLLKALELSFSVVNFGSEPELRKSSVFLTAQFRFND